MGLIAQDIIRQVIDRADIVEVIGRYTAVKKAGSNFKALCPFHHEKTPSFVVNPDKQIFHCFGCGAGGNVVAFIMRQERLEFPQAIRFLAEMVGIEIIEDDQGSTNPAKKLKEEIYKVNALALEFFHQTLLTSREDNAKIARDYLKARGIDLETVKKFQLGFAPDEWDSLIGFLKSKAVPLDVMQQAGLIIAREKGGFYDRFRGRIIFPIFDIHSHPVAFGARALNETDGAKYINSPETPVYTKGRHLFGLNLTKSSVGDIDHIVIVEGYMDMIMPFVHGVKNIAASLGTALTVDQIKLIRRYTSNVIMLFDTDPAGQAAIIRSLDLLIDEDINVKVATLAQGEDPDSFIRQSGLEAFQERLKQSQSLFEYKFNWLSGQIDPQTIEGKDKICKEMLLTIGRFKSEVTKFELKRLLAQKLNVPEEVITKESQSTNISSLKPKVSVPEVQQKPKGTNLAPKSYEELLIALFIDDHEWVLQAKDRVTSEDFTPGVTRDIVEKIWQMTENNSQWDMPQLMTELPQEATQSLIAKLVSNTQARTGDVARIFEDCLERIYKERLKKQKEDLLQQIKDAESNADHTKLDQLRAQFHELIKK